MEENVTPEPNIYRGWTVYDLPKDLAYTTPQQRDQGNKEVLTSSKCPLQTMGRSTLQEATACIYRINTKLFNIFQCLNYYTQSVVLGHLQWARQHLPPTVHGWPAAKTDSEPLPPNCRGTPLSSRSLQVLDLCREKFSSL